MSMPPAVKLYAYVDESGQDTLGRLFVVTVVLVGEERDAVLRQLEALEARSGKGRVKWRRAKYAYRQVYIEGLAALTGLTDCLFAVTFAQTQAYVALTVEATARAIRAKARGGDYRVTVFVDGLTREERPRFSAQLRQHRIARKKVRGVRDETSSAGVRLADALCGLIRDAEEGQAWAVAALARLRQRGLLRMV